MKNKERLPVVLPCRPELKDTPVKLCNEISRLFFARMRECWGHDGVMSQPGARMILQFLISTDGVIQRDLVEWTHLKAPSVSVILQKMEQEGLVHRCPDDQDLRQTRVYLTDAGRALDGETIENILRLARLATDGLSEEENAMWKQIDDDMMNFELKNLMKGEEYRNTDNLSSVPAEAERPWREVEDEFEAECKKLIEKMSDQPGK